MQYRESDKLDIIHAIETEDVLRTELLIPLFQKMGVYEQIYDVHGSDEKGKDIVLVQRTPLGGFNYTAVIVKNKPITNSTNAKDKELVGNIATQIGMAINSGYACTIQNQRVGFSTIVVITGKSISNSAKEELLKINIQFPNVQLLFKEDKDIIKLVDEYLPEFYSCRSAVLSNYIQNLRQKCEKLDELKNISLYRGETRRILEIYVNPILRRVKKKEFPDGTQTSYPVYDKLENLIHSRGNIIITSGAGGGKSTLVRAQIQKMIQNFQKGSKYSSLPILIRAVDFIKYCNDQSFENSIEQYIKNEYNVPDFDLHSCLKSTNSKMVIFIDGLDEIPEISQRNQMKDIILVYSKQNSDVKIVLTSRETENADLIEMPGFIRWYLMPFNYRQVREFINKWFNHKSLQQKLLSALKDHDLLSKLPSTPLVLTLLAILFDSDTNVEVPANLSELYQMFTDLLVGRWNLDRRLGTFFNVNDKEYILEELAEYLHTNKLYSINREELADIIHKCSDILGRKFEIQEMIRELVEQTCIIALDDKDQFEFRHLSFQEFYVAKRYLKRTNLILENDLVQKHFDNWWTNVVYFYCGLKKENDLLLDSLNNVLKERSNDDKSAIMAICNFGYLIQSSYQTHVQKRKQYIIDQLIHYADRLSKLFDDIDRGIVKTEIPPIIILLSMIHMFKMHYYSKYIAHIYLDIFNEKIKYQVTNFTDALPLLILASILSETDGGESLIQIYDSIHRIPILNLALDYELTILINDDNISKKRIHEIKKIASKLRRQIMSGRNLYRTFFIIPKASKNVIVEASSTSEEERENKVDNLSENASF